VEMKRQKKERRSILDRCFVDGIPIVFEKDRKDIFC
jgi:hypothetical protein